MDLQKELERIKKIYRSKYSLYSKKALPPKRLTVLIQEKNFTQYENFYFYSKELEYLVEVEIGKKSK